MEVVALIGPSGTGKSYKAIVVAKEMNIEYIIDDGLLIKGNKVVAGRSAKRENSAISAVKRALFLDNNHRLEVSNRIKQIQLDKILILGTSDKMVDRIAEALNLPKISKKLYIEHISTPSEINAAKRQRKREGKHVIPVPTFEIKKDFSGYFIDTLKILRGKENKIEQVFEKTVVRPTFSYLGNYTISNTVIKDLSKYVATRIGNISRVLNIYINSLEHGVEIDMDIEIVYGSPIIPIVKEMQLQVIREVEHMTSLNILAVNVTVKKMTKL